MSGELGAGEEDRESGHVHLLEARLLALGPERVLVLRHREARVQLREEGEDDAIAEQYERKGANINLRRGRLEEGVGRGALPVLHRRRGGWAM